MKIDGGIAMQLDQAARAAQNLERRGYDGGWTGEISHDVFLPLLLAAEHTERIEIGTCIAVAFARNPMTIANAAWDLNAYSKGRFVLGLGSQIRPHIEKRFGMPWGKPVARMREFVAAVRAIWACWNEGAELRFEGEYYRHTLMTPMFVPEPQPYGTPHIFLAAVGEAMTELCGEIADGMHTHAFTSPRYIEEISLPALTRGIEQAGRTRGDVEICCPAFVVTGAKEEEMVTAAATMRRQISFYGSTPAYKGVLDVHGLGDLQPELRTLSMRGEWDAMAGLITDDILETFAVVQPIDKVAGAVRARYEGLVDRIMMGLPNATDEQAAQVLAELRA
jgi:probable F420-dependent oxidoreductase